MNLDNKKKYLDIFKEQANFICLHNNTKNAVQTKSSTNLQFIAMIFDYRNLTILISLYLITQV